MTRWPTNAAIEEMDLTDERTDSERTWKNACTGLKGRLKGMILPWLGTDRTMMPCQTKRKRKDFFYIVDGLIKFIQIFSRS